ncbi:monocarboxylate transporter 13-like [Branchiostoma floridae x Branchiostoma belcheri]
MSSMEGNSSTPRAAEGPEEGPPGKLREAPDGGWGWCVVLAGFTVCFCTAGTIRSLGVFFLEFVDQFDSTYGKTSWITSITLAAMYGGGTGYYLSLFRPLASLVDRAVGPRCAVMLGGVTAACGCMCASFATRVVSVYLTLGVMTGFGFSLAFLPTMTMVGRYFDKRRTLANALAWLGACTGNFALPPVFQLLIDRYGWRGALVVISGIALNCCVCGALLRPIRSDVTGNDVCRPEKDFATHRKNAQQTATRDSTSQKSADDIEGETVTENDEYTPEKYVVTCTKNTKTETESDYEKSDYTDTADIKVQSGYCRGETVTEYDECRPEKDVVTYTKIATTAREYALQKSDYTATADHSNVRPGYCRGETITDNDNDECTPEKDAVTCTLLAKNSQTATDSASEKSDYTAADHSKVRSGDCRGETITENDVCRPEKDVVTSTLLAKNSQTATDSASEKSDYTATADAVILTDSRIQTETPCGNKVYEDKRLSTLQKRSRCKMLGFSLLRKRHFVLYLLSFAFLYFGYYVPFVHLVPRAVYLGVGEYQAAFLVSVLSVGDFVGRVAMGTMPEIPKYGRRLHKYVVASSMLGVCSLLCPLAVTYTAMLVHSVVYGFVNGLIIPLTFAVAADLVGTKRLASGIGLLMMAEGIAASLGPPVAGALYDLTGNYNMSFLTAGSSMVLAGVIMVPVMLSASKEEQPPLDTTELVMDTREKDGERLETVYERLTAV